MKVSLNIIKKFVNIKKTPQEIADKITISLTEVERVEKKGDDTILTIENKALTHRPDCFSHLGMAREIAAFFSLPVNDPLMDLAKREVKLQHNLEVQVKISDTNLCPRYCAVVLTDLKVGQSPHWLKDSIEVLGVRSINNVVDVTNYVMLELGQPLHAFDYDNVGNHTIIVRTADKSESITTLDDKEYQLDSNHLVIADSNKPIGLAGIMGGANTEVGETTKTIILESAKFDAKNNRKTSNALGIRTEAATRFEKNTDPTLPLPAMMRAIELLQEVTGASVASEIIDINHIHASTRTIDIDANWINTFIGIAISAADMTAILKRLSLKINMKGDKLTVIIPSWRPDLTMPADIAEEVARIYGYDRVPVALPIEEDKTPRPNASVMVRKQISLFLKGIGATEVKTSPFVGTPLLTKSHLKQLEHLTLVNPLTGDQEFMRRSLIPQLLDISEKNKALFPIVTIFEIDRVFTPKGKAAPDEHIHLGLLITNHEYRVIKGIIESLMKELHIHHVIFEPYQHDDVLDNLVIPSQTAQIAINDQPVGIAGFIKPEIVMNFNLQSALVATININELVKHIKTSFRYHPIPRYPPIIEDLTFVFPPKTSIGPVIQSIRQVDQLIVRVELIDSYEQTRTFRIHYQDPKKSLTDNEVKIIRNRMIKQITASFKGNVE